MIIQTKPSRTSVTGIQHTAGDIETSVTATVRNRSYSTGHAL